MIILYFCHNIYHLFLRSTRQCSEVSQNSEILYRNLSQYETCQHFHIH